MTYNRKKWTIRLNTIKQLFFKKIDKFDEYTTDYLVTNSRRAQRNDTFIENDFDRELFLKKNLHILLSTMRKIFYYKKLKTMTADDTKLIVYTNKMSFDNKELRRIILNYRVACKHEENLCLFICIFEICPIETLNYCLILTKQIGKRFAINVWLLKNF